MRRLASACLILAALAGAARAEDVPRIKGRIVDFDGLTFHLAPEDGGAPLAVRLQSDTSFATLEPRRLSDFKVGAYAGATVRDQDGTLTAEEVQLYPKGLRGSGEGRLPQPDGRIVINGAITASGDHGFTLFYRGAGMTDGVCLGRADPRRPSPVCTGDAAVTVPPAARVTALVLGDKRLLVPGAIATVSLGKDERGQAITPGLILEKPQTPE